MLAEYLEELIMKQHITLEQWDELTHEQKDKLDEYGCRHDWKMSIGQMIEFLGDDLKFIRLGDPVHVELRNGHGWGRVELCDALWSACKRVLNG